MKPCRLLMAVLTAVNIALPLAHLSGNAEKQALSDGRALYKKHCAMCHFPDKADKKMGPGMKDLFKNKELPSSKQPATPEIVREKIAKGGKGMPAFAKKLSAEECDALMEYLETL